MSGCPALDLVNDASLSGGLRAVDCQINYIVTAAYQRLFGSGGVFGAILTSVLTIYVAFIAYSLLTGRTRASITELAPKVIGIGIILTFATTWPAYSTVVYELLIGGPDQIVAAIAGGDGAIHGFATRMDKIFSDLVELSQVVVPKGKGLPSAELVTWLIWISSVAFMLLTVGLLITTRIVLGVLLALGPIFMVTALFKNTRGLFEGWLRTAVAMAITPMFVVIGGSGVIGAISPILSSILENPAAAIVEMKPIAAIFLITTVYALLLITLVWASISLTRNWRLPQSWQTLTHASGSLPTKPNAAAAANVSGERHGSIILGHANGGLDVRVATVISAVLKEGPARDMPSVNIWTSTSGSAASPSANRRGLGQRFRKIPSTHVTGP